MEIIGTAETAETEINTYDPNRLLDALLKKMHWKNDAVLAQKLNVHINVIQRIRSSTLPLAASMLLWMQEATGVVIDELRRLMGDRRAKLRISCTWTLEPSRLDRFTPRIHPSALPAMTMPVKLAEQRCLHISCQPHR
ncbi:MAG: hypothetical protein ACOH2K_13790 [Burkholderiaceae bacterium]